MDKYIKVRDIGEGTFGRAILVKLKSTQEDFVIKQIKSGLMSDKNKAEARKEVEVLKQLQHENIVSYIDSFEEKGCLHIVMLFYSGGNLAEKIYKRRNNRFEEQEILTTFRQLCQAVDYMHRKNILHRDIKPENIFLTGDGVVKLGDFGLAKVLDTDLQYARTLAGTLCYISPEIINGKRYKSKSDIWSLGCVLYELTALNRAFPQLRNIISGNYTPVPTHYSLDLQELVKELLNMNPEDRPSASAILKRKFIKPANEKSTFSAVSDLDLLLVGGKGNGRSATGNTILGIPGAFKESSHFETGGLITDVKWARVGQLTVKVVDGPSLVDENFEVIDPAQAFCHCLRGFHAVLLVLNYASPRLTTDDLSLIKFLKKCLGKDVFRNYGIVIFTHGECFDLFTSRREWMTFDTWCRQQEGALGDLIKECSNRVILFHNLTPNKHAESVNKLKSMVNEIGTFFTCDFLTRLKDKHVQELGTNAENIFARIDLFLNAVRKYLTSQTSSDYTPLKDASLKLLVEINNGNPSPDLVSLQSSVLPLTRGDRLTNEQLLGILSDLNKVQEPYKVKTLNRSTRQSCSIS